MSDSQTPLSSRANPADEAVRETRHQVLRELLGAYADRELPPETSAQIDAHLIGCAQCRRELELHDSVRGRLAAEPPAAASPALRARIAIALDSAPLPAAAAPEPPSRVGVAHRRLVWIAIAGWVVALMLSIVLAARADIARSGGARTRDISAPVRSVPLLEGIVSDYARVSQGDLPGRARDLSAVRAAVSFPIEPLRAPNLRLLAAWTTDVRGEPAAVLAYRLEDRLVVQYLVAEDAFFRHPAVRSAVADRHLLVASDSARSIVAWPETATGTVLVGNVPSRWLRDVWMTERLR
ncbi:MAG: zf-HC2 domain-containing protein [Gemmatimonadaceae bacterium]